MLVACRLAGLSALDARYPGRPFLTSSSTAMRSMTAAKVPFSPFAPKPGPTPLQ